MIKSGEVMVFFKAWLVLSIVATLLFLARGLYRRNDIRKIEKLRFKSLS